MDDMRTAPDIAAVHLVDDVLEPEAVIGGLKAAVPGSPSLRPSPPEKGFQARLVDDRDREAVRGILPDLHGISVFRAQAFSDRKMGPVRRSKAFLTLLAAIKEWAASKAAGRCFFT